MKKQLDNILNDVKRYFQQKKFKHAIELLLATKNTFPYSKKINDTILQFYYTLERKKDVYSFIQLLSCEEEYNGEYDLILADCHYHAGSHFKALVLLHSKIKLSPNVPELLFKLALNYKGVRQYQEAIDYTIKSLGNGGTNEKECYFLLSTLYTFLRQEESAIRYLTALLELEPNNLNVKLNLAILKLSAGQKNDGVQLLESILQAKPEHVQAMVRLAYVEKASNQDGKLLHLLEAVSKRNDTKLHDKASLQYAIGKLYDDKGNYERAINSYRKANELSRLLVGEYEHELYEEKAKLIRERASSSALCLSTNEADRKYTFIVGHFRSGSTLVEQIISSHSKVDTVGELDFFLEEFWNKNSFSKQTNMVEYFKGLNLAYSDIINQMVGGDEHVIDKRPENILLLGLIKRVIPNAKFIYTRRGLADVALSIYFQNLSSNCPYSTDLQSIASYNKLVEEMLAYWKLLYPDSIYEIQYENLLDDQDKYTKELLDFMGIDFEDNCLHFQNNGNFVRTASTQQVREKIYKTSVGRYNNYIEFLGLAEKRQLLN